MSTKIKLLFLFFLKIIVIILDKLFGLFVKKKYVLVSGLKARYFTGNNKFLFEYFTNNNVNFDYFFYTKDKNEFELLNQIYPDRILYPYNLKTLFVFLQTKIYVVSSGIYDFSPYTILGNRVVFNIWHGTPIKKVGEMDGDIDIQKFIKKINFFTVSSDFDGQIIKENFKLTDDKIFVSGLAKNDYINNLDTEFIKDNKFLKQNTIILYAPTFRENGSVLKSLDELFDLNKLNEFLELNNALFLYRYHLNSTESNEVKKYKRIINASSNIYIDAQNLLYYTDILITDYSGIYFDFLLMEKPIVFYNYDYDEYEKMRGFLFDYSENTPGTKVKNKNEALKSLQEYIDNPTKDIKEIIRVKDKFHKYNDGNSCKRITEKIIQLM